MLAVSVDVGMVVADGNNRLWCVFVTGIAPSSFF